MERSEGIEQAILDAITDVNETLGPEEPIPRSEDTVIFGATSQLDSIGLVTLLTAVEENMEQRMGETVSLMDLMPTGGETVTVASFARTIAESIQSTPR